MRAKLFGLLLAGGLVILTGCGPVPPTPTTGDKKPEAKPSGKEPETEHDGWWCDEHGIPEHECSMCSKKVREQCKAKNDWCDQHNRAKSQCFKCDPTLKEKFAVKYKAHFGADAIIPPIGEEIDGKK